MPMESLRAGGTLDCVAVIFECLVVGEVLERPRPEEVIDAIFQEFCIRESNNTNQEDTPSYEQGSPSNSRKRISTAPLNMGFLT